MMWAYRVLRDVAQLSRPLLSTRNEETVLYAQVQARVSRPCFNTFYWCYIIRSNNTSWCPLDQSEWINCLRYLWMCINNLFPVCPPPPLVKLTSNALLLYLYLTLTPRCNFCFLILPQAGSHLALSRTLKCKLIPHHFLLLSILFVCKI